MVNLNPDWLQLSSCSCIRLGQSFSEQIWLAYWREWELTLVSNRYVAKGLDDRTHLVTAGLFSATVQDRSLSLQ